MIALLLALQARTYASLNMTLAVVGNIVHDVSLAIRRKYYLVVISGI